MPAAPPQHYVFALCRTRPASLALRPSFVFSRRFFFILPPPFVHCFAILLEHPANFFLRILNLFHAAQRMFFCCSQVVLPAHVACPASSVCFKPFVAFLPQRIIATSLKSLSQASEPSICFFSRSSFCFFCAAIRFISGVVSIGTLSSPLQLGFFPDVHLRWLPS